jgi:hypothetical protein
MARTEEWEIKNEYWGWPGSPSRAGRRAIRLIDELGFLKNENIGFSSDHSQLSRRVA